MLNRSTLPHTSLRSSLPPPSLTTSLPQPGAMGINEEFPRLLTRPRWQALARWVQLPTSLQGYLAFLLCLLILAFAMALHILLSAEILRLEVQQQALRDEYAAIERRNANTIWQISQYSALADVDAEARERGYIRPVPLRYVLSPQGGFESLPLLPAQNQGQDEALFEAPVYHTIGPDAAAPTAPIAPDIAPERAGAETGAAAEPGPTQTLGENLWGSLLERSRNALDGLRTWIAPPQ